MTWFVKARRPDGKVAKILCDEPKQVRENVEDQRARGFEVWIEDVDGTEVDEKQFSIGTGQ